MDTFSPDDFTQIPNIMQLSKALALEKFQYLELNLDLLKDPDIGSWLVNSDDIPDLSETGMPYNVEDGQISSSYVKKLPVYKETEEQKLVTPMNSVASLEMSDICNQDCLDFSISLPRIERTESENSQWNYRGICEVNENVRDEDEKHLEWVLMATQYNSEQKHQNLIKEMNEKINELNEIIEETIKELSRDLTSDIELIKDKVEYILAVLEKKPLSSVNTTQIVKMNDIMRRLKEIRIERIEKFSNYIKYLEEERSKFIKLILKFTYKEMHEILFLNPYQIQQFFEDKLQHFNQLITNNYHCYIELEGKLKLQMEEDMKIWLQKVKFYEFRLERDKEEKLRLEKKEYEEGIAEDISFTDLKSDILSKLDTAEQNLQNLMEIIHRLEYLKTLPMLKIFKTYFNEMGIAANCLFDAGFVDNKGICLDNESIKYFSKTHNVPVKEIEALWYESIKNMIESLGDNCERFSHSTKIFDCYIDRFEEIKTLYRQQLSLLINKNNKAAMKMNMNVNLLIDTLRQESNDELYKVFDQIKNTITDIDTVIQSNLKDEIALVEKFEEIYLMSVDVLITELTRFRVQFVPPRDADPRVMRKRRSWMDASELANNDHFFTRDLLKCRFIILGIDNWQFGLWEAFITSTEIAKSTFSAIFLSWSQTEKQKLLNRSEIKTKINDVRLTLIEEDFLKVRMAELKFHESRYEQHENGINENIRRAAVLRNTILDAWNKVKPNYKKKIEEVMIDHEKVKKKHDLYAILKNITNLFYGATHELIGYYQEFSNVYCINITDIQNSHYNFLQSITLFYEDGNFNVEEMKTLMKRLMRVQTIVEKEFSKKKEIIDTLYDILIEDCTNLFEIPLNILNESLEELTLVEDIEHKVQKLHTAINGVVCDIKFELRKIDCNIKSLTEASYSEKNLGHYEWVPIFSKNFKVLLNQIDVLIKQLAYDESICPLRKQKDTSSSTTNFSKLKKPGSDEKKRSFSPNSGALDKTKNITSLLYNKPPVENDSFLSKLHTLVYESFNFIQEIVKTFYDTREENTNFKFVPIEFKLLMEEIVTKYKYYQIQLEFIWLESFTELSTIISKLSNFLNNYHMETIKKYAELTNEKLSEKFKEVEIKLQQTIESISDYHKAINNTIKPIFGHPQFTKIFTIVDAYIDQTEEFTNKHLADNLEKSKEVVKTHCGNAESLLIDMDKILTCIKNDKMLFRMKNEMQSTLLTKIDQLKIILHLDYEVGEEEEEDQDIEIEIEKKVKLKLNKYKEKSKIPFEEKISLASIIQDSISTEKIIILNVDEIIKKNFNICKKYCKSVQIYGEEGQAIHTKYKDIWQKTINKILDLYKLKYDFLISETETCNIQVLNASDSNEPLTSVLINEEPLNIHISDNLKDRVFTYELPQ